MPSYKIRLSENQKEMIEYLVDPGKAPGIVSALETGQQIIIGSSGNPIKEHQLLHYLQEIGAKVVDGRKSYVVLFNSPRQGRGGERKPRAAGCSR